MAHVPQEFSAMEIATDMYQNGILNKSEYRDIISREGAEWSHRDNNAARHLRKALREKGFDSIAYMSKAADRGSIGIIPLDESQLTLVSENGVAVDIDKSVENVGGKEYNVTVENLTDEILNTKPKYAPICKKWLDNGGKISIDNEGIWTYTSSSGISVRYVDGYPDFKGAGLVIQEVDIGEFKGRASDSRKADKLALNGPCSETSVWHHSPDGHTMQEIEAELHQMFTHRGGISKLKGQKKYGI